MKKIIRTVRMPLERPDDETWKRLRGLACEAAEFGNSMLAGQYVQRMAGLKDAERTRINALLWANRKDSLGSCVRGAMETKCKSYWSRSGKNVLAGRERLACFSGDRALAIKADQTSNKGVLYERDGEDYVLACRFEPVTFVAEDGTSGKREPIRLKVDRRSASARKDQHIGEALEYIWSGTWEPAMVTIRFDRIQHTIDAMVTYKRPLDEAPAGERSATLGPLDEHGRIWLRCDDGSSLDCSGWLRQIRDKKLHFAGQTRRILRQAGSAGRKGKRYEARRALSAIGTFDEWAEGPLNQWVAAVVRKCKEAGSGTLIVDGIDDGDWPAYRLRWKLQTKGEDNGIAIVDPGKATPSHVRAKAAKVRKQAQKIARAKEGLEAIRQAM